MDKDELPPKLALLARELRTFLSPIRDGAILKKIPNQAIIDAFDRTID
jgi:hypothetical protein